MNELNKLRCYRDVLAQEIRAALGVMNDDDKPVVILVADLCAKLAECESALPGVTYMDPPDGGSVTIGEQLRRMAKDAARYRWLRGRVPGSTYRIIDVIYSEGGAGVDAAIDAAMAKAKWGES